MLESVSAGECKCTQSEHSHCLKLRISFGTIFFSMISLSQSLGVLACGQSCPQSSFICSTRKAEWAKPDKLVGAVEGEGGAD